MDVGFMQLGDMARGAIQAGEAQQEHLEDLTRRVGNGEFHVPLEWPDDYGRMILVRCVDGRLPENASGPLAPNSAGGTISLFVADDLTEKQFIDDGTTRGGLDATVGYLRENGYEVGGHTDSHAADNASGCGANDKLEIIYKYIMEHGDTLRSAAGDLGVVVSDEAHQKLMGNAKVRSQFSSGRELLNVLDTNARSQFLDHLAGSHNEVITVINLRANVTLDRRVVRAAFGEKYQAFNVDAWAFEAAAKAISAADASEDLIKQKVAALTYYNLATALVLAGPKMRLVTLR